LRVSGCFISLLDGLRVVGLQYTRKYTEHVEIVLAEEVLVFLCARLIVGVEYVFNALCTSDNNEIAIERLPVLFIFELIINSRIYFNGFLKLASLGACVRADRTESSRSTIWRQVCGSQRRTWNAWNTSPCRRNGNRWGENLVDGLVLVETVDNVRPRIATTESIKFVLSELTPIVVVKTCTRKVFGMRGKAFEASEKRDVAAWWRAVHTWIGIVRILQILDIVVTHGEKIVDGRVRTSPTLFQSFADG